MRILGTGSVLPEKVVTNDDLTAFLDTSDEWISTRTGIRERRVMSTETLSGMGGEAGRRALENAGIGADELDMIICTTLLGETVTPGLSCQIQKEIGASCPCIDMNGACAGFLYALDMADAYISSGKAGKILIVSAEELTRMADWTDRSTCVLFGDGAGAVVVGEGEGVMATRLTTNSNTEVLYAYPAPGNNPFRTEKHPFVPLQMMGQEVYKFAVSTSSDDIRRVAEKAGVEIDQIDHFILHQANLRIVDAVRHRMKVAPERFPHNIERTGNTSSASVPILLDELNRSGALKKGQILALSAFGAGLSTGACILRWTIGE